jgi:hypothetical protein
VTTVSGLLGIALQTPIGAAIDVTRAKRAVIVATMTAMSIAAVKAMAQAREEAAAAGAPGE